LSISNDLNLGIIPSTSTTNITFDGGTGGTLQVTSNNTTVNANRAVSLNAPGIFDTVANVVTIAGAISGNSSLSKVGSGTLILSGASSYEGGTTISAGLVTFMGSTSNITSVSGAGNMTIASNATLISDGIQVNALDVEGSVAIRSNGNSTSVVSSLTIGGSPGAWTGALDLSNNALVVQASNGTKATVKGMLQDQTFYGRAHSTGITSSTIGLANTTFGIAVVDNGASTFIARSTFGGVSVGSNSVLVAVEVLGDANIDNHVDLTDLSTVLNNFGLTTANWWEGNFDGAATVDLTDLSDVLNNFGDTNVTMFSLQEGQPAPGTVDCGSLWRS
jgi:autotransporter-associated beta strand protein